MSGHIVTITTYATGQPRIIEVHTYRTLKGMRIAGRAYSGDDFTNALDITHSGSQDSPTVIRLAMDAVTPEIAVHEAAHAAIDVYRIDLLDAKPSTGEHLRVDNEELAYCVSEIATAILTTLWPPAGEATIEEETP